MSKPRAFYRKLLCLLLAFLLAALSLLFLATGSFASLCLFPAGNSLSADAEAFPAPKVVVLDAGHGGIDSGARSSDGKVLEKDLNLALTRKVAAFLSLYHITVVETRPEDALPEPTGGTSFKRGELLTRVRIAAEENADVFISIHMNSYPEALCSGTQIFYTENHLKSEVLAVSLHESIETLFEPEGSRALKQTKSIFLLNRLPMPAVLIECGFLSNPKETALLCDEAYQNRLAFTLAAGIAKNLFSD